MRGHHPANPFEQNDGRDYAATEVIVARLEPGDWLEFELAPESERSRARALGPDGREVGADITASERGIIVTARETLDLARVVLGPGA